MKRILHATDFSRASRGAFKLAQEQAKAFRAELILFHAYHVPLPMVGEGYIPAGTYEKIRADARDGARRELDKMARAARRARIRISTLLAEGPAAEAIVRAARARRAGLIVLGTHGRTGLRRMLIGSVAERVVRTAPSPVLTVGPRGA
jgi:nucleotide-binding universal stress UspA family protein